MYLVLLCCVVVAAIFSPSHVKCSAVNRIESYLEENNAIVESRSVALPSGVINCGEFQIQNSSGSNTLGSDWFSKTTSRNNVDANQICMDQGYDGQILHYGGNWGVQCGRKLGAVASERLESLGDTVAWKCEMKALVTHEGWCRDKDGAFQQLSHGHETILANCEKGCNTNPDCDAFSYETPTPSDFYNCYHYKSGPYTAGSGRPDTKCYIVERAQGTTASENTGIETTAESTTTTAEILTEIREARSKKGGVNWGQLPETYSLEISDLPINIAMIDGDTSTDAADTCNGHNVIDLGTDKLHRGKIRYHFNEVVVGYRGAYSMGYSSDGVNWTRYGVVSCGGECGGNLGPLGELPQPPSYFEVDTNDLSFRYFDISTACHNRQLREVQFISSA